jgi:hypothetical protein
MQQKVLTSTSMTKILKSTRELSKTWKEWVTTGVKKLMGTLARKKK